MHRTVQESIAKTIPLKDKVLELINRLIPFLVMTPRPGSFGNCTEEMFFGLLRAKRENKKILFLHHHNLFFRKPVANKKLFHLDSEYIVQNKYIVFVGTWIVTVVFALVNVIPSYFNLPMLRRNLELGRAEIWRPGEDGEFSWESFADQNWEQQYDDYAPPTLLEEDHRHAERLRVEMGIPLADWFVCLHVRESGYRGDTSVNRNASIEKYTEGIKVITDAGGWVVRLGDSTMTAISPMHHVVDYPHTEYKSESMDLYLISQCRFLLGTTSGPSDVAQLFATPMLLVNATEWSIGYPLKRGDMIIAKHLYSRKVDRFLSITEILQEPFIWQAFSALDSDYMMVENTSLEIRDAVIDFLGNLEEPEYSELQRQFKEARINQVHLWIEAIEGAVQKYRIASRADPSDCTMGRRYLEENWFRDSLGTTPEGLLDGICSGAEY